MPIVPNGEEDLDIDPSMTFSIDELFEKLRNERTSYESPMYPD